MFTVIIIMSLGILSGYILRNHRKLFARIDQVISWVIYLLLFLLGLTVGQNDTIVKSFHLIGMKAFLISAASVAGSLLLAAVLYRLAFRSRENKEAEQ